jgi:hypothetical protein
MLTTGNNGLQVVQEGLMLVRSPVMQLIQSPVTGRAAAVEPSDSPDEKAYSPSLMEVAAFLHSCSMEHVSPIFFDIPYRASSST